MASSVREPTVDELILMELKKQTSLLEELLRPQREADRAKKPDLYCEHCDTTCASKAAMELHKVTYKHRANTGEIEKKQEVLKKQTTKH